MSSYAQSIFIYDKKLMKNGDLKNNKQKLKFMNLLKIWSNCSFFVPTRFKAMTGTK